MNNNFITEAEVLEFLKKRVNLFDGVVLSGGECTSCTELYNFIEKIKKLNFKIKIDTNGLNYNIIHNIVKNKLIDFIALDFKAPKNKFTDVTQIKEELYNNFKKTLNFLIEENNKNNLELEIRTTVHTNLLQENDINIIIDTLDNLYYKKTYFIQNFRNDNKSTLVNLGNQKYILNKDLIKKPLNFKIDYRNFF